MNRGGIDPTLALTAMLTLTVLLAAGIAIYIFTVMGAA